VASKARIDLIDIVFGIAVSVVHTGAAVGGPVLLGEMPAAV